MSLERILPACLLFFAFTALAEEPAKKAADPPAEKKEPAPPAAQLRVPRDFEVELLYNVPKDEQGSWVSMTVDPRGRLIVSDQYGRLYRVTLPSVDTSITKLRIEPIDAPIGEAQGLLWAFDSLYVVVNRGRVFESGLYRVRDTDGDDCLDAVEQLIKISGGAEHGPHGVILTPDGKSLYIVEGNNTQVPNANHSLVPKLWGEETLLPNMPDGAGFMTTELAPGGHVIKVNPDGTDRELVAIGFRNPYDIALNQDGELFTFDSDMEWDVNLPWYRPTRALHVVSGGDYGYRGGSSKFPAYCIDSLPPVADVGPGSPTGITFGYGAKFPAKYQQALFLSDWSYGKLYALHLTPQGATYGGKLEEFITGTPLALTDIEVNPYDGAMYFLVGGRQSQSGLYRVRYTGSESTAPAAAEVNPMATHARAMRHRLEAFHGHADPAAVDVAWPYLGHADRFIRAAARTAIEFQDPAQWRDRALAESSSPEAALEALLALARAAGVDPGHRPRDSRPIDTQLRDQLLEALGKIDWDQLDHATELDLLRVYTVVLNRFGRPDEPLASQLLGRLDSHFPGRSREANAQLVPLMVYLEAPSAAGKTVKLLENAPTQEEQIDYARALRVLKEGWTPELRRAYATWFVKAADYKGGNSFRGFMNQIRSAVLENLSENERDELKSLIQRRPSRNPPTVPDRPFVKNWTLDELTELVQPSALAGRDFERGRTLFAATRCFSCHRFADEGGGLGPELTGLAGRFSARDLLESIVVPSKVISDQYAAVVVVTTDDRMIMGRIVNLNGDELMISPDMLAPNKFIRIKREDLAEEPRTSAVSMMPEGLLNTLKADEVLDLMAYLLSRGDRQNPMFSAR